MRQRGYSHLAVVSWLVKRCLLASHLLRTLYNMSVMADMFKRP